MGVRRGIKFWLRWLSIAFGLGVACVLVGAYLMLATDWGRSLGATLISRAVSTQSQGIEISGLNRIIGGQLLIDKVALSDKDGIWLQISDITVAYRTSLLLRGNIQLDFVHVGEIRLHHLPTTENAPKHAGSGQPVLPARFLPAPFHTLALSRIDIDQVAIGEHILGIGKRLSITGRLSAQNTPLISAGDLQFTDLDSATEIARTIWTIDPENDDFALALSLAEDTGGLVAGLLNIPERPALAVQMETNGPLSALHGKLAVDMDHKRAATGDLLLALGKDNQQLTATLKGDIAPFLPEKIVPFVASQSDLQIDIIRDNDGNIDIKRAAYSSTLTQIVAAGRYAPGNDSVDLRFDAQIGAPGESVALAPGEGIVANFSDLSLSGTLNGSLQLAALQVDGTIAAASYGDMALKGARLAFRSDNVNLEDFSATSSAKVDISNFWPGNDELNPLLSGGIQVRATVQLTKGAIDVSDFRLESAVLHSDARGKFDFATSRSEITLNARIKKSATGLYRQLFANEDATLTASLTSEGNRLTIKALDLKSANLGAQLIGQVDAKAFQLQGKMTLAQLALLHPKAAGQMGLELSFSGPFSNPGGEIALSAQGLVLDGEPLQNLRGKINGTLLDGVFFDMRGNFRGEPLQVSANYSQTDDQTRRLNDITVLAPASRIKGALSISPEGLATGTLDFDLSDLAQIAPLLLQDRLAGALAGSVRLQARDAGQSAVLRAKAPKLAARGMAMQGLDVQLNASDIWRRPAIDGALSLQNLQSAAENLNEIQLQVSGGPDRFPVRLNAVYEGEPAAMQAVVTRNDTAFNVAIDQFSVRYKSIPLALSQPVDINIAGDVIVLRMPALNAGEGRIAADAELGTTIDVNIDITRLPLALIDHAMGSGQGLQGVLNARAKVTGTLAGPVVSYEYTAKGLSVAASREAKLAALDVTGKGEFAQNTLSTNNTITGSGMAATMGGKIDTGTQSLQMSVDGNLPLEYFTQPLSHFGVNLTGAAAFKAQLAGSAVAPRINGNISVSRARVLDVASKLSVSDINGTVEFDNDTARIANLGGKIGASGQLKISGTASLRPADNLASDFRIAVRDAIFDDGVVSTKFNAALRLAGALATGGKISGTATIAQATVTIPEKFPNVVSPVEVQHKSASSAVRRQAAALAPKSSSGASANAMTLAIGVDAPRRIYIRGRGLDAELGGKLKIAGTTAQPKVTGVISMRRGRINLLSKRFDFDTGQLAFSGPTDPALDFSASTRSAGHIYSIVVRGFASEPEFLFRSSPSLPQDEIIARMFFGKSLSRLSALQIAQLASAVATLTGANSGPGLLDRLRNLSGLDNIDIKSNEQGETTVGIGAYLNDRTYMSVEKGANAESDKVSIDLEITESLKARGQTSGDGNTKAGIFFEKDY